MLLCVEFYVTIYSVHSCRFCHWGIHFHLLFSGHLHSSVRLKHFTKYSTNWVGNSIGSFNFFRKFRYATALLSLWVLDTVSFFLRFLSSSIYVDCIQTRSNFYDEGETEEGWQWEKIFSVLFSSKRCLHKASQPIIPFWWPLYLENKIDRWKWGWNVESKTWQPQNANMNCFWKS